MNSLTIFAVGVFGWGKGNSVTEALKNMRARVAAEHKNTYVLYATTDENASVNMYGGIFATAEVFEIDRKGIPA